MKQIVNPKNLPLQRLAEVFSHYPEIQAVYLFGSVAAGTARPESDLDLAIVPRHPNLRRKKLDILTDLARAGFDNVDLVLLDIDDIVLKYEAIRQNRLVYQTKDFDPEAMYSKIIRQYLDFQPYLEVQRHAYKRRILVD